MSYKILSLTLNRYAVKIYIVFLIYVYSYVQSKIRRSKLYKHTMLAMCANDTEKGDEIRKADKISSVCVCFCMGNDFMETTTCVCAM